MRHRPSPYVAGTATARHFKGRRLAAIERAGRKDAQDRVQGTFDGLLFDRRSEAQQRAWRRARGD